MEQQSENLRGAACDNNRRTAPEGCKFLNPPFIHHCHHVSSWITKWGRRLPTLRANKHVSPAQTEALCLSEPMSFDHHGHQHSCLIFWAVQGGLVHSLGRGKHLVRTGRSDSATPCSESIFTQWLWVWGRDDLPPGSHSHPPEWGGLSHQSERVQATLSWEHNCFF